MATVDGLPSEVYLFILVLDGEVPWFVDELAEGCLFFNFLTHFSSGLICRRVRYLFYFILYPDGKRKMTVGDPQGISRQIALWKKFIDCQLSHSAPFFFLFMLGSVSNHQLFSGTDFFFASQEDFLSYTKRPCLEHI